MTPNSCRQMGWLCAALLLLFTAILATNAQEPAPQQPAANEERRALEAEALRMGKEAERLDREGKLAEAIAAAAKVLEIDRKLLKPDHPKISSVLDWLATRYERMEDFTAATKARAEVLEIQTRLLAKDDWRVTNERLALAHTKLLSELTPENRRELERADARQTEANEMFRAGKSAEALAVTEEVLKVRQAILGELHPKYAASLANAALLNQHRGNIARAEMQNLRAIEIRTKIVGEMHPDFARSLNNLAFLYRAQDDIARAEPLYRRALEINKQVLGEAHPDYATSLNNLAATYGALGDYSRAMPLYLESVEIKRRVLGEDHADYAMVLNNLAELYRLQGDFVRAEPLYLRALEIQSKAIGEAHPEYAITLGNLAGFYENQGKSALAEPMFRRVLEINRQALGEAHPDYGNNLNNVAAVCVSLGKFAEAEALYLKAMQVKRNALGDAHPHYATSLSNLAGLYRRQGDLEKAAGLGRRVVEIRKDAQGESHPDFVLGLNNLAGTYMLQGEHSKAEALFSEAVDRAMAGLELASQAQSQRQQVAMTAQSQLYLDNYLLLTSKVQEYHERAYERVLRWKGMVLARQLSIRAVADRQDLAPVIAELQGTTKRLATLSMATPSPEQAAAWRKSLAELSDRKEELEGKLAAASAEYRAAIEPVTIAALRSRLPADGAFVDFLQFSFFLPDEENRPDRGPRETRLAAFVVRPKGDVRLVVLPEVKAVQEAIDAWREGFGNSAASRDAGTVLRDKLWLPIEEHLAGARTVLISPEGELGKLAFAALPGKKPGSYLLEDYVLAVVPAARSLILPEEGDAQGAPRAVPGGNLLLLGGVDYDRRSDGEPAGELPKRQFAARAVRDEADEPFDPLPGTKGELATIQKLYQDTFGADGLKTLDGAAATQEALLDQAPNFLYLHLATHGYFASPRFKSVLARSAHEPSRGDSFLNNQSLAGYHPGLLSGIALAGVNHPTEEDDGILTAEEIGSLNLSRCELVVLSACESGLGQAAGGEGLLGLQRSFQAAGAKTVIASLWKVDDVATRDLMERFYENLWGQTKPDGTPLYNKVEALREAQLWMLKERGPRGATPVEADLKTAGEKRLPPYYWAAFVLSGDWR